jgi:hypothetical protein
VQLLNRHCDAQIDIVIRAYEQGTDELGTDELGIIPRYQYFSTELTALEKWDHYFTQLPIEEIYIVHLYNRGHPTTTTTKRSKQICLCISIF